MWTQIIKTHMKSGKDAELMMLSDQLKAIEQPGSGLVRSTTMRDQKDPSTVYMIVTFESEEKARIREHDERRQCGLQSVRETMAQIFDEAPESSSSWRSSPSTRASKRRLVVSAPLRSRVQSGRNLVAGTHRQLTGHPVGDLRTGRHDQDEVAAARGRNLLGCGRCLVVHS